jgi:hypothetical protein
VALSLLVPNSQFYVDEGNYFRFDLFDIVNAPSIRTSDSFELSFFEFDDVIMQIEQNVTIKATPGKLSHIQVLPEGYRVREKVPYIFQFVTDNRVFTDSIINIVVPREITVQPNNLTLTAVTNIND